MSAARNYNSYGLKKRQKGLIFLSKHDIINEGVFMNKIERMEIQKQYTEKMVDYLPVLRASAQITQNQLAKKLGVTRSTAVAIESRKRPLQWYMYLAMITVFMQNEDSKKLLESFRLYDAELLQRIL